MTPTEINTSIMEQEELRNQQVSDRTIAQDQMAFKPATILGRDQTFGLWIVLVETAEVKATALVSNGLSIGQAVFYYKPPNQAFGYIKSSI
jgi:hypothetical protein